MAGGYGELVSREVLGQLARPVRPDSVRRAAIEDVGVRVLVHANRIGKGEQSGVEIQEQVFQLFTFADDGPRLRVQEFYDRARADAIVNERAGRAD